MISIRSGSIIVCAMALAASSVSATVITVTSSADAFVASSNPNNNYGGAGGLAVSASGLPNGEFESVIRFDTSAAKAAFDAMFGAGQWHVVDVGVQFTATSPNNPIFNMQAAGQFSVEWMQNDSWVEGTGTPNMASMAGITYANLPSFLSGADQALATYPFDGSTSGAMGYGLAISSGVSADILAGALLSLHVEAADSSVSYVYHSRNFATTADRPMLFIAAESGPVPAMSTWGMIFIALSTMVAGTLILRRKQALS